MKAGLVSVVIPCFNSESHIKKTIQSCLDQGGILKEVIVVDDFSNDNTYNAVKEISKCEDRVTLIRNNMKGANNARNLGFKLSSGLYIQWLDADDLLLPDKFHKQVNALTESNADIAFSDFRFDEYEGEKLFASEVRVFENNSDYLLELMKDKWNASHSYLVKRDFAEMLDDGVGWNPETRVGQDREYFTMAGILGARFHYVPGVYAVYNKQTRGTISGMDFTDRLELNQVLENHFREQIDLSDWISSKRKKVLFRVLNTHKIKACFYNPKIKLNRVITPGSIDWSMMHWKMKLAIPLVLLRANIRYFLGL